MTKQQRPPAIPMNVLKMETCPSLSGRSQLTYQIGKSAEGVIHLRITQNSSSGQFNADWVSLDTIEMLVSASTPEKPLSSSALCPAFTGKSSNSPAFLFAALKAESLVTPHEERDKGYLLGDFKAFRQSVATLAVQEVVGSAPESSKTMPTTKDSRRKGRRLP